MKTNSFIDLINSYIDRRDFKKCNELLKKEIVYIYTQKVRMYDKNYCYSTTVELLEVVKNYLLPEDTYLYISFYNLLNESLLEHEKTYELLDIYNKIIK